VKDLMYQNPGICQEICEAPRVVAGLFAQGTCGVDVLGDGEAVGASWKPLPNKPMTIIFASH
jgi:hypothetical protein